MHRGGKRGFIRPSLPRLTGHSLQGAIWSQEWSHRPPMVIPQGAHCWDAAAGWN